MYQPDTQISLQYYGTLKILMSLVLIRSFSFTGNLDSLILKTVKGPKPLIFINNQINILMYST